MTDQQFSELMKVLKSINTHVENIWKGQPDSLGQQLINIKESLSEIKSSVDEVDFTLRNKD